MQNATKKLIASLSVVLMGIGIAGAANAETRNKTRHIMVLTQKGDGFFKVITYSKGQGRTPGPCRKVNGQGWMDGQISGTVGDKIVVIFYGDKNLPCTSPRNFKYSPDITITAKNNVNFWLNYPH